MATSQAAPATIAAVGGGGPTSTTTSETIAGLHVLKIDNFSGTKDLGVGKSVKSSTFRVGWHRWYIECYPCGVDEGSDGWVSLYLCRQEDHLGSRVSAECKFTLMESLMDNAIEETITEPDRHSRLGTDFIQREELESILKDDCFYVRCTVCIDKFPYLATETVAGSHVLTIDGYSQTRELLGLGDAIDSCSFRVGGLSWCIQFYPCGEDKNETDGVTTYLCLDGPGANDEVKVRYQMILLTRAGQIIASSHHLSTFTDRKDAFGCYLGAMEHESLPLLHDSIHIRCDMAVVEGITAMPNLCSGIGGDLQLQGSQQVRVRGDVTFEVGGHLFPAHKCVLTTRCTAFMAEFIGPAGKENAGVTDPVPVRIDDMEPRVFEALLHFIYTDALPEVGEEDKIVMAQGLLVAADRFGLERLKLMCSDMLYDYMNDACTALDTLELAVKHGCHRLKEKCKKFLKDKFAKVAP